MFTIQTYTNNSEKNAVNKSLTASSTYTGTLKDETSIVNPKILIESSSVPTGNYARIDAFNRYYFITDVISVRNNLWEISMKVDVLMTYANAIKSNKGVIARQENIGDNYLIDNLEPLHNDVQMVYQMLNGFKSFNTDENVFIINGGVLSN